MCKPFSKHKSYIQSLSMFRLREKIKWETERHYIEVLKIVIRYKFICQGTKDTCISFNLIDRERKTLKVMDNKL